MPGRPKGVKETAPRRKGAGRKPFVDYAARADADPDGGTDILLRAVPNATLAFLQVEAQAEGVSVPEWVRRLLSSRVP